VIIGIADNIKAAFTFPEIEIIEKTFSKRQKESTFRINERERHECN
jgi:hypothetical protein